MSERRPRQDYDPEFKRNAVALSYEDGKTVPVVAQSLGIRPEALYRWRSNMKKSGSLAFPGKGKESFTPEQKEIKELKRQLRDAEMERDILKKAVGIFSKQPR